MPRGAQPLLFHYMAKGTPLHAMDPRAKLALLLLVGIAIALAHRPWQFALVGAALVGALVAARLPLRSLLRQALPFAPLIAAVFATKLFLTPGSPLPLLGSAGATWEGAVEGGAFACRMLAVVALCTLMMATTTLRSLEKALGWALRPVPLVPAGRVATAFGLTFTMLPVLMDSYRQIADAQASRCANLRRNPLSRMLPALRALLGTTMRRADEIAYAMESRCYSEVRSSPEFAGRPSDKAFLLGGVALLAACWL